VNVQALKNQALDLKSSTNAVIHGINVQARYAQVRRSDTDVWYDRVSWYLITSKFGNMGRQTRLPDTESETGAPTYQRISEADLNEKLREAAAVKKIKRQRQAQA
jgi:hypothetical protein